MLKARLMIESGMSVSAAARNLPLGNGKTAEVSSLNRRLRNEHPGWYQDMRDKGIISEGRGLYKTQKEEYDKERAESLAEHPAVKAVYRGETYEKALDFFPDEEEKVTAASLHAWVRLVAKHTGQVPPNTRRRRKRKKPAPPESAIA